MPGQLYLAQSAYRALCVSDTYLVSRRSSLSVGARRWEDGVLWSVTPDAQNMPGKSKDCRDASTSLPMQCMRRMHITKYWRTSHVSSGLVHSTGDTCLQRPGLLRKSICGSTQGLVHSPPSGESASGRVSVGYEVWNTVQWYCRQVSTCVVIALHLNCDGGQDAQQQVSELLHGSSSHSSSVRHPPSLPSVTICTAAQIQGHAMPQPNLPPTALTHRHMPRPC